MIDKKGFKLNMLKYIDFITKNDLKILTFFIQAKFSKYVYFFPIFGSIMYYLFFQNLVFTRINDNKVSFQLIIRIRLIIFALQIMNWILAIYLFVFSMSLGFSIRWDIQSIFFLVISCFLFSFSPFLNFICIFWNKFYLQKIVRKILSLKTFDKNEVIMEDEEQINDYKQWINNVFHSDELIYKSQLFTQDLSMPKKRSIEDFWKKYGLDSFYYNFIYYYYYFSKKFLKYRITLLCIYINNALKIQNIKTIPFKKVILLNTILSLIYWLVFIGICLCLILIPVFTYNFQWSEKIVNNNFKKAIVFHIFFFFLLAIVYWATVYNSLKLFHVWFGKSKKQLLMKMIYKSIDKWNKTNNI